MTTKIDAAVARLERNLPIRRNQARLPGPLRDLHRRILRFYLEQGRAPSGDDFDDIEDWRAGVERLAAEHILVLDRGGAIAGAYPFVSESREYRVATRFGAAEAMCAFDALAVSPMFGIATRIESRCRLSGQAIVIEQNGADLRVVEPAAPVFAAIDWQAAAGASRCSATLCLEMVFIAGSEPAAVWSAAGADRERFDLHEARAVIGAVFVPLMAG